MRLGLATTRALLSAAEPSAGAAATAAIAPTAAATVVAAIEATAQADSARSLYRTALRHLRALSDGHARSYYRAYARQSINAFRDEQGAERVAQLLKHGREAAEFLSKKHGGGSGKGGGVGGKGGATATTAAAGGSRR